MEGILLDHPRSGQPATFTDEQIIKILEVACHNTEEYGFESSHWSLNQLVEAVVKEGIVDSISVKTISRFFNMGKIRPHLIVIGCIPPKRRNIRKPSPRKSMKFVPSMRTP